MARRILLELLALSVPRCSGVDAINSIGGNKPGGCLRFTQPACAAVFANEAGRRSLLQHQHIVPKS